MKSYLSNKSIYSYAFGDFGCCLLNYMISFYLPFYCTVELGIPMLGVGTIIIVAQVWDAVNDILIGQLIDRKEVGQRKSIFWIKSFMIPCCVFGALIFACPTSLSINLRAVWVGVMYATFTWCYTSVNLPYSILMSEMTEDKSDLAKLGTSRYVGAYTGILIVALSALPVAKLFQKSGYTKVMVLYCILAFLSFIILVLNCREKSTHKDHHQDDRCIAAESSVQFQENDYAQRKTSWINFDGLKKARISNLVLYIRPLCINKAWLTVILLNILYWFRYPFYGSVMPYYYRFYLGRNEAESAWMNTISILAGVVTLPFITKISTHYGYKKTLIISCVISAISMALGFFTGNSVTIAIILFSVNYVSEGFPCVLLLAILAEILHSIKTDNDRSVIGLGFAANSFMNKVSAGGGGFLVMLIFQYSKFNMGNLDNSMMGINIIRSIFWLIPSVLSILMAVVLMVSHEKAIS